MGRFDKFFDTVNKVADPTVQLGDESTVADNPRNWLTGNLNKVLPDGLQIPQQTVADDKQYMQNLPEQIGGATMGSVGRFGDILDKTGGIAAKAMSHADIMAHPDMVQFMENAANFKKANPFPSQYDAAKQAVIAKIKGQ